MFRLHYDGSSWLLSISAPRNPELINNLVIRRVPGVHEPLDSAQIINRNVMPFMRLSAITRLDGVHLNSMN